MISANAELNRNDSIKEIDRTKRSESDDPIVNNFCHYLQSTYQVIGALIIANQIRWRVRTAQHDAIVIAIDKSSPISKECKPIAKLYIFIISLLNDVESRKCDS